MSELFNLNNEIILSDLEEEVKIESKRMSKVFFAFIGAYILSYVLVLSVMAFLGAFKLTGQFRHFVSAILSMSLMPLTYLFTKRFSSSVVSNHHPVMEKMTFSKFFSLLFISFFIMVIGNIVGVFVNDIISGITKNDMGDIVGDVIDNMGIFEIVVSVVIIAPVFEELVFRKLFIDKLSKYGTKFSIFVSALIFALVHGNFQQFFYAFGLGILLSYVYCIYGNILYTIAIHAAVNSMGSLIPVLIGIGDTSSTAIIQNVYIYIYFFMIIIGAISFFSNIKNPKQYFIGGVLLSPGKALFKSKGFYIAVFIIASEFILNLFT